PARARPPGARARPRCGRRPRARQRRVGSGVDRHHRRHARLRRRPAAEAAPMSAELWPYVLLLLVGFLPNEIWRWLGIVLARGLDETAPVVMWVRAVATAVLGGVIVRI